MEFFPHGRVIDFMKWRKPVITASIVMSLLTVLAFFYPGPNLGTDFAGGTELQVKFRGNVTSHELREALESKGFEGAEVINVQGSANEYIVRVHQVSPLDAASVSRLEAAARTQLGATQ